MGRASEVQECLQALNSLHTGTYYTVEELEAKMPPSVPKKTMMVVLDHTVEMRITTRIGQHFLIRRQTSREDFLTICGELNIQAPDGPAALPSDRMKRLEDDVGALQREGDPKHYWISLNFDRMPAQARQALRDQAAKVAGAGATDRTIETQMLLLAARILTHALRTPMKEPAYVLPPRPLD